MYNNFVLRPIILILLITLSISCDSENNTIGADIVGIDNFTFEKQDNYTVNAFSQELGAIESVDLPINPLGVYNNPVFGLTIANIVTQLQLGEVNPTINAALDPRIESVVLTIPYESTKKSIDAEGDGTYELDSIYGIPNSPIDLGIYESGYFIRDIDVNSVLPEVQKYYTNQNSDFDMVKGAKLNDNVDTPANQNTAFVFDPSEYSETVIVSGVSTIVRTAPSMRINLDKAFFTQKILQAPAGKLLNNNVFKDYFRGLYFKVGFSGSAFGNLTMLNIKNGKITIKYKENKSEDDSSEANRVDKTIVLNFSGKSISLIEHGNANVAPDSQNLVLKGGANGSMTIIDLFGTQDNNNNGVSDELDQLRNEKRLINDASLTFYIDKNKMGNSTSGPIEPNRIYLYDLNNRRPLLDYYSDQTASPSKPKYSKRLHGGIITKEADERGIKYKIRITNHLRRIINFADSTNVRLGLVVTEDINVILNKKLKTPVALSATSTLKEAPTMSVVNPFGTILFGSNIPFGDLNYDKRLKLEIYYTKPKLN